MSVFKRRRFPTEIILMCVRWYCKYGISYRDLAEMMQERGVAVDHTTVFRWVQRYAPEIEKRVRWYQGYRSSSWRVDETHVRAGGAWKHLFRAVGQDGSLDWRNTRAAHRFLGKTLKTMRDWPPVSITTDKLGSYRKTIKRLQARSASSTSCLAYPYDGASYKVEVRPSGVTATEPPDRVRTAWPQAGLGLLRPCSSLRNMLDPLQRRIPLRAPST